LEHRFPETAAYVDELLTSVHYAIDSSSAWERLIEDHGQFSNVELRVVQLEERSYPVRRGRSGMSKIEREPAKRIPAQYEVKLRTRFTFKIDSPLEGILSV
jgi:hypothetical protein